MKEFLEVVFSFDKNRIFTEPTQNPLLQFFRYGFVGAWATLADWGMMVLLTDIVGLHYLISAVGAFLAGLMVNFLLSKRFVFSKEKSACSPAAEFAVYGVIGVIGLGMTWLVMLLLTKKLSFHYMISKIIATGVVFVWNFAARKVALYR